MDIDRVVIINKIKTEFKKIIIKRKYIEQFDSNFSCCKYKIVDSQVAAENIIRNNYVIRIIMYLIDFISIIEISRLCPSLKISINFGKFTLYTYIPRLM